MRSATVLAVATADGLALEAEWAPPDPRVPDAPAVLLCHPHPQYGGSMRALLVGELFRGLPAAGGAVARFNFRGVERSAGTWSDGIGERLDVAAALDALDDAVRRETGRSQAVVLVGWSFGADLALSARDERVAGWVAIAPPFHWVEDLDDLGGDPRPKAIVLGARDDLVLAEPTGARVAGWRSTSVTVVAGADHFFVGATTPVVEAVTAFVGERRPASG